MNGSDPKAHLGRGFAFPLAPVGGRLRLAQHEAKVEQAIELVLRTERGERVMRPRFGAGVRRFVFEPNAPATHRALEEAVRQALVDWEPRIDVEEVRAVPAEDDPARLLVHVDYVVRATNAAYNRVFPFHLLEGRD